ncbi:MAG TPA: hypothetical protein VFF70_14825 [Anaerolineae bacterium]|jgi:hypothetical protein|nr:hypothetical protein [Anaerolineae bacterium]
MNNTYLQIFVFSLLLLYIVNLRVKLWLDHKVIQQFQKSAIIVPNPDKKHDFGPVALMIAALALLLAMAHL